MIDTFFKAIYHTYSFDNENTIKMNDSMMDIFHYVTIQFKSCIGMNKSIVVYWGCGFFVHE